jgi:hypothetical protein
MGRLASRRVAERKRPEEGPVIGPPVPWPVDIATLQKSTDPRRSQAARAAATQRQSHRWRKLQGRELGLGGIAFASSSSFCSPRFAPGFPTPLSSTGLRRSIRAAGAAMMRRHTDGGGHIVRSTTDRSARPGRRPRTTGLGQKFSPIGTSDWHAPCVLDIPTTGVYAAIDGLVHVGITNKRARNGKGTPPMMTRCGPSRAEVNFIREWYDESTDPNVCGGLVGRRMFGIAACGGPG